MRKYVDSRFVHDLMDNKTDQHYFIRKPEWLPWPWSDMFLEICIPSFYQRKIKILAQLKAQHLRQQKLNFRHPFTKQHASQKPRSSPSSWYSHLLTYKNFITLGFSTDPKSTCQGKKWAIRQGKKNYQKIIPVRVIFGNLKNIFNLYFLHI